MASRELLLRVCESIAIVHDLSIMLGSLPHQQCTYGDISNRVSFDIHSKLVATSECYPQV